MSHTPAISSLDFPWSDTQPGYGKALTLLPGVKWVRMPLPFALNHINLWLLRDEIDGRAGWSIVDCGLGDAATRTAWEAIFATELDGLPVLRVIATHMHPDHIGQSDWLTRYWSHAGQACRLWISAGDYFGAKLAMQSNEGVGGDRAATWFASHGLTDLESLNQVRGRGDYFASMVPGFPQAYHRIRHDDIVRVGQHDWRCIVGFGHAPEHQSLYCAELGVLISGDMLLPRISTNISVVEWEPEGDPLDQYLRSLDALRSLPPDTLVLPSHGLPFRGAHVRIDQLHAHHADRLALVLHACRQQPVSAADLLGLMFRPGLDLHQTTFAMGEAIAHLNHLWLHGQLRRERAADGVWHYSAGG